MTVNAQFWLYFCQGSIKRHTSEVQLKSGLLMRLTCVHDKLRTQMFDLKAGTRDLKSTNQCNINNQINNYNLKASSASIYLCFW